MGEVEDVAVETGGPSQVARGGEGLAGGLARAPVGERGGVRRGGGREIRFQDAVHAVQAVERSRPSWAVCGRRSGARPAGTAPR